MLVDIDEKLIQAALEGSDAPLNPQDLVHQILLKFIRNKAGERLADLGGQAPAMKFIAR